MSARPREGGSLPPTKFENVVCLGGSAAAAASSAAGAQSIWESGHNVSIVCRSEATLYLIMFCLSFLFFCNAAFQLVLWRINKSQKEVIWVQRLSSPFATDRQLGTFMYGFKFNLIGVHYYEDTVGLLTFCNIQENFFTLDH